MVSLIIAVDTFALTGQAVIGLGFLIYSFLEREKRPFFFAAIQFICMLSLLSVFVFLSKTEFFYSSTGTTLLIIVSLVSFAGLAFLIRKTSPNEKALQGTNGYITGEIQRFDERKVVFSRVRYLPGTKEYEEFYQENPELFDIDEKRRAKGFVLGTFGSIDTPNEKPNVASMVALRYFGAQMARPEIIRPKQAPFFKGQKEIMSQEKGSEIVKGYAKHLGASLVGIAKLNPHWVYSHIGTIQKDGWDHGEADWSKWGQEIKLDHKYVIVFAEEMDREMIASSPHTPCFVESMKNYAKGAFISTQLAAYIANLGYSATANHVHQYELILPPLAADAGLGEVGRLGYLMTKEYGPRVRLSAVTTDMPLALDKPVDIGVEDFCRICKKCATTCPSKSIPITTDMSEDNGILRWKLDADSCFSYWAKIGTDCCICMRVCPWSHARTWPHKLIVWCISRNKWARRLFNHMDDIFYGTHPKAKMPPGWANYHKDN